MKVFRDKQGNKLTRKEFMERWKGGIQNVTPLQQARINLTSTKIILLGVFCGIVIAIYNIQKLWWVLIILLGVAGVTSVQLLGAIQKRNVFEKIDKMQKEVLEND